MQYLIFGLVAGVLAGLFGIGGGVIVVPALIMIAKFPPQRATGTSLAALLLPVGILGVWKYWSHGSVDIKSALLIALGLLVGAYFGAEIALGLPPRYLQKLFSVFLAAIAVYLWWSA